MEDETAFLTKKRLTHIVCRNSGGSASYTKIKAARDLGLPVIMIDRPHRPGTHTLIDIESVSQFVDETFGFTPGANVTCGCDPCGTALSPETRRPTKPRPTKIMADRLRPDAFTLSAISPSVP